MKRSVLLFVPLFLVSGLYAQTEWAPVGTVWYYDRNTDYEYGYVRIESVKDSLVQDQSCRILRVSKSVYRTPGVYETVNLEPVITRQEGSRVHVFQDGQFRLLYDFAPLAGDIWTIGEAQQEPDECPAGQVIVDSVRTVLLGGQTLKAIYTSPYGDSPVSFTGKIVEGVGCLGYLLPFSTCDPPEDGWEQGGPVRCYSSPAFSYSWSDKACDYITGINVTVPGDPVLLYPNPFSDIIRLKLPQGEYGFPLRFTVWSMSGTVLLSGILADEDLTVYLTSLESGVYFLSLSKENMLVFHTKILKK